MQRRWLIFTVVGVISFAADLATKIWAKAALPWIEEYGVGKPITVIENFFDWRLAYNTGSAFGLFSSTTGSRIFLSVIGIVAVVAMLFMVRSAKNEQTRLAVALGLVAGGALGNVLDRILYGKVTDFVVWKYYEHQWPAFNVADVTLVIGMILLFFDFGKTDDKEEEDGDKQQKKKKKKKKK
jgi:signal peptidase II